MPELPDVELAKRRLDRALGGSTVTSARSGDRRILRPHSPNAFTRALVDRAAREVGRRGEGLGIPLHDGGMVLSHLGVTGWWVERETEDPPERAVRARTDLTRRNRRLLSVSDVDAAR